MKATPPKALSPTNVLVRMLEEVVKVQAGDLIGAGRALAKAR